MENIYYYVGCFTFWLIGASAFIYIYWNVTDWLFKKLKILAEVKIMMYEYARNRKKFKEWKKRKQ